MEKRGTRYKCPFNYEEKRFNFSIMGEYWHCFSCNKNGDKIAFVQELYNVDRKTAVQKIISVFGLEEKNIDSNYLKELDIKKRMREKEQNRFKLQEFKLNEALDNKIKNLNSIINNNKPYNINKLEKYSNTTSIDRYFTALKQLSEISMYRAILYEMDLLQFDKEYNNIKYDYEISNGYSFYLFPTLDKEERRKLKNKLIKDYYNGIIKIGDINIKPLTITDEEEFSRHKCKLQLEFEEFKKAFEYVIREIENANKRP
jgi:hypothetical protein